MKPKPYVGRSIATGRLTVFYSDVYPSTDVHGRTYRYVIGPFRTVRGARYMAAFGENNPHCITVDDAEDCAKRNARRSVTQNENAKR